MGRRPILKGLLKAIRKGLRPLDKKRVAFGTLYSLLFGAFSPKLRPAASVKAFEESVSNKVLVGEHGSPTPPRAT